MDITAPEGLVEHLSKLEYPRVERHGLVDVVFETVRLMERRREPRLPGKARRLLGEACGISIALSQRSVTRKREAALSEKHLISFLAELYEGDLHVKRALSSAHGTLGVLTNASVAVRAIGQGLAHTRRTRDQRPVRPGRRRLGVEPRNEPVRTPTFASGRTNLRTCLGRGVGRARASPGQA